MKAGLTDGFFGGRAKPFTLFGDRDAVVKQPPCPREETERERKSEARRMPAALTTLPIQKRVARTRETTNQGAERARESGEKVLLNPRVTHAATAADEQMATQIWIFR